MTVCPNPPPNALFQANGYKDNDFIALCAIGQRSPPAIYPGTNHCLNTKIITNRTKNGNITLLRFILKGQVEILAYSQNKHNIHI